MSNKCEICGLLNGEMCWRERCPRLLKNKTQKNLTKLEKDAAWNFKQYKKKNIGVFE